MNDMKLRLMAASSAAMIEAAAHAYADAISVDYASRRAEIMQETVSTLLPALEDANRVALLADAAGLTKEDPSLFGELMSNAITGVALRAAAKVLGEPPAKDEADPASPSTH